MKFLFIGFLFFQSAWALAATVVGSVEYQKSWKHMKKVRQCQMCHVGKSKNQWRLLTGEVIDSSRTPELCAQCHGTVMRKWESGTHGKKTGTWQKNGEKLFCIKCHNPHSPKFPHMKADPAPPRPKLGIKKESEDGRE